MGAVITDGHKPALQPADDGEQCLHAADSGAGELQGGSNRVVLSLKGQQGFYSVYCVGMGAVIRDAPKPDLQPADDGEQCLPAADSGAGEIQGGQIGLC